MPVPLTAQVPGLESEGLVVSEGLVDSEELEGLQNVGALVGALVAGESVLVGRDCSVEGDGAWHPLGVVTSVVGPQLL